MVISPTLRNERDCESLKTKALANLRELADDICASVPFHLGTRIGGKDDIVFPNIEDEEVNAVHKQTATVQGWFSITLPLSRLLKTNFLHERQRQWVLSQYDRICSIVGHKHCVDPQRVAGMLDTALPFFCTIPINSRHLKAAYRGLASNKNVLSSSDGNAGVEQISTDRQTPGRHESCADSGSKTLQCWDHRCNGRTFANRSNLARHRKERKLSKWVCGKCGVSYTRRSAYKAHTLQDRCSKYSHQQPSDFLG